MKGRFMTSSVVSTTSGGNYSRHFFRFQLSVIIAAGTQYLIMMIARTVTHDDLSRYSSI
jgi:hypothetical protein